MHHIVAVGSEKARASVATLQAYGIDLDSPANGVFLPYRKNELVTTEAMHCGGHLDSYHKTVETKLSAIIDVADDVTKKKVESSVEDIKLSRFSEMEESEILKIVEMHRKKAPIKIPESANVKAKSMNEGYEQISYKWNDGIYKYEVRWHTRTPGAPKDQGNTWVIQRTKPGNGGQKPSTQFLIGDNEWVEGWKWYDAIKARKEGTATKEQIEILDRGHWKE